MSRQSPNPFQEEPDLNDYWDGDVPAPHRLGGSSGSPYPSSRPSSTYSDPFRNQPVASGSGSRGQYAPVGADNAEVHEMHPNTAAGAAAGDPFPATDYYSYNRYPELKPSKWLKHEQSSYKRSKWVLWGSVVTVAALIIGGIVAGAVISAHKHSSSSDGAKSKSSNNNNTNTNNTSPDPGSDPSKFTKNPALKNSFYGFGYTPVGAILPECGANRDSIIQDIQLLSQLTTRIRTYGSDCNVSSFVLDAIAVTKVDLQVYLGIYVDNNDTVYERQRDLTQQALQQYGVDHVAGITVGNEFILDNMTALGATDPTGTVGVAAAEFLKTKIADVRSMISGMSLSKTIPIGTSDAGSYFNQDIVEACDYCMANVHPWFGSVTIDQAAEWTANFFQVNDVELAANTTNDPKFYIAETGWPTNSSTAADMANGAGAQASVANLQEFMNTFVCQANSNNTGYFFFEFMDEPWKTVQYGGVEGYWGIFDSNKNLKDLTIPDCSHQ